MGEGDSLGPGPAEWSAGKAFNVIILGKCALYWVFCRELWFFRISDSFFRMRPLNICEEWARTVPSVVLQHLAIRLSYKSSLQGIKCPEGNARHPCKGEVVEWLNSCGSYKAIVTENAKCVPNLQCWMTHRIAQSFQPDSHNHTDVPWFHTFPSKNIHGTFFKIPRDKEATALLWNSGVLWMDEKLNTHLVQAYLISMAKTSHLVEIDN